MQRPFARQTLLRIHERSGGNPFFALELARILPEEVDPLAPLAVPDTVEELLTERISALPASTRRALALAAAVGTASESLLQRASVSPDALDAAVAARVVERDAGTIRFTHPLLSSVIYAGLGDERQSIHAHLATIVDDPVLHARHLALSTVETDTGVARLLEDAAGLASDRGASALTAELAEHALRLTPTKPPDERARRALSAARAHLAAGEWTRARSIAHLLAETADGPLRAEALLVLAEFRHDDLAVPFLEEAAREASSQPALHARIQIRLAEAARFRKGFAAALDGARAALALADDANDDVVIFEALAAAAVGSADWSATPKRPFTRRAHTSSRRPPATRGCSGTQTSSLHAGFLDPDGIVVRRTALERAHRDWCERDELFSADVLWELSWVEFWGERWALAADYAARARDIRLQYGVERNQDYIPSSWVAAHRGQLELAQQESQRALRLSEEQIGFHPPLLQAVPGLVALWSGDAADGSRLPRQGRPAGDGTRLGRARRAAVDGRLRGGAADARLGRRGGARHRSCGKRTRRGSAGIGCMPRCCDVAGSWRRREGPSTKRCPSSSRRSPGTTRSAIPSGGRARCSHSAPFSDAHGRSVRLGRPSTLRSPVSCNSARPRGSRTLAPSSGGSAGARARTA